VQNLIKLSAEIYIVLTNFLPYLEMMRNPKIASCDVWPWNSTGSCSCQGTCSCKILSR